jgi:hypothetical protein
MPTAGRRGDQGRGKNKKKMNFGEREKIRKES